MNNNYLSSLLNCKAYPLSGIPVVSAFMFFDAASIPSLASRKMWV